MLKNFIFLLSFILLLLSGCNKSQDNVIVNLPNPEYFETKIDNPEHLLASMEKENISLYFDKSPEEYSYHGAYIKSDSNISYYDWDFYADMYWMPELTLLNNKEHLLVQFVDGHGTGVLFSRAYVIDLATMEEIPIQSPFEILDTHLQVDEFNHETGVLRFHYLDETVALEIDSDIFDIMAFDSVGYESFFRYEIKDDTLFFWTTLQVSPTYFLNNMTITYKFENGEYQFDTMKYIQE